MKYLHSWLSLYLKKLNYLTLNYSVESRVFMLLNRHCVIFVCL